MKTYFFMALALLSVSLYSQSATDILNKMDANSSYTAIEFTGSISTTDRYGTSSNIAKVTARGSVDTLVEITTGEQKGQRILRTPTEVYVYYPDADNVIRLKGAALRQSFLGGDISYEDLTSIKKTSDIYNATILEEGILDGKGYWKLNLIAKDKGATYPEQILWVDKASSLAVKGEYKSASGKLIKTLQVNAMQKFGNNYLAMESEYIDVTKKNSSTILKINSVILNPVITSRTFSVSNLSF